MPKAGSFIINATKIAEYKRRSTLWNDTITYPDVSSLAQADNVKESAWYAWVSHNRNWFNAYLEKYPANPDGLAAPIDRRQPVKPVQEGASSKPTNAFAALPNALLGTAAFRSPASALRIRKVEQHAIAQVSDTREVDFGQLILLLAKFTEQGLPTAAKRVRDTLKRRMGELQRQINKAHHSDQKALNQWHAVYDAFPADTTLDVLMSSAARIQLAHLSRISWQKAASVSALEQGETHNAQILENLLGILASSIAREVWPDSLTFLDNAANTRPELVAVKQYLHDLKGDAARQVEKIMGQGTLAKIYSNMAEEAGETHVGLMHWSSATYALRLAKLLEGSEKEHMARDYAHQLQFILTDLGGRKLRGLDHLLIQYRQLLRTSHNPCATTINAALLAAEGWAVRNVWGSAQWRRNAKAGMAYGHFFLFVGQLAFNFLFEAMGPQEFETLYDELVRQRTPPVLTGTYERGNYTPDFSDDTDADIAD